KSVIDENGGIDLTDNSSKRLKKIDLYSKADLKKNGILKAKPIKTVNFEYDYSLCAGVPDNDGAPVDKNGNVVGAADASNVNNNRSECRSMGFEENPASIRRTNGNRIRK